MQKRVRAVGEGLGEMPWDPSEQAHGVRVWLAVDGVAAAESRQGI